MSHDYYDPAPRRPLARPVVLTGFLGASVGAVASSVSALTGHPLFDLDRAIAHAAGSTTDELVLREGVDALRALERRLLPPALRRTPPPIVALGEGTLLDPDLRGQVSRDALLIYIRIPLPRLVERIREQVARNPGRHYAWLMGLQPSETLLAPLLEARRAGYEAAQHVVDGDRDVQRVAREIVALLP